MIERLPKVPRSIVRLAQSGLGLHLDVEGAAGDGQGQGTLGRRDGAVMLAHGREVNAQIASNPSESPVIAQPLSKGLGGAQVVEDPRLFAERHRGTVQVVPHIEGLLQCVAMLGKLRQGRQRLLKIRHGFAVR